MIAFLFGFLLDLIFGDPYFPWHPIRLIGRLIMGVERMMRREDVAEEVPGYADGEWEDQDIADCTCEDVYQGLKRQAQKERSEEREHKDGKKNRTEFHKGVALVIIVCASVVITASLVLWTAYRLHPYLGMAAECFMAYQILAVKCLKDESMKVYRWLKHGSLKQAREAVSMIVGRDTECLDEEGVVKATVETVAENTSDGVIAPMLYLALGGPVLGFFYKAVNTMDSMVGYRNKKYLYFGRAAARMDDFMNYLPSRISAYLMIAVSFLFQFLFGKAGKDFSGRRAYAVHKRDCRNHASPNSAQTESVCAGALGIRLAGDASYFGEVVRKPYIGDALRRPEYEDIRRANCLLYGTAWMCEALCLCVLYLM